MKRLVICVLFSCLVFRSQASGQTAIISTIAGSSTFGLGYGGFSGDGGPATSALLNGPSGVAVDGSGNLFIADLYNARIRRVSADGIITTVAGNAISGLSGDGGLATSVSQWTLPGISLLQTPTIIESVRCRPAASSPPSRAADL
jgi:DNA-binding beta-propeller fold protein YncE